MIFEEPVGTKDVKFFEYYNNLSQFFSLLMLIEKLSSVTRTSPTSYFWLKFIIPEITSLNSPWFFLILYIYFGFITIVFFLYFYIIRDYDSINEYISLNYKCCRSIRFCDNNSKVSPSVTLILYHSLKDLSVGSRLKSRRQVR